MSATCPVCGEGHITSETRPREFGYRGITMTSDHTEEYCDTCGTLLQSPATVRENVRNIQRAKNVHDGLLSGEEILSFREAFQLTQRLAGDLFGGGPTAFAKYECNEISHNVSMDRLLRLCMGNPANIAKLASIARLELPEGVVRQIQESIESKIRELLSDVAKAFGPKPFIREPSANEADFQGYVEVMDTASDEPWLMEELQAA